jgi:hypothetical protein
MIGQDQTADGAIVETGGDVQEQGQSAGTDLKSRVMQGGDFAWEQIQKRDRHSSELANRVKELEPVEQLVKFAGSPDQLYRLADLGNRVAQVPGLMNVVNQALQTGRVEVSQPAPATDEEWIDPDVKKVRDSFEAKFAELEARLENVNSVATHAKIEAQQKLVTANTEKALKRFEKDPELYGQALSLVNRQVESANIAARRGDLRQQEMLDKLATDEGVGIFKFITNDLFEENLTKLVSFSNTSNTDAARAAGSRSTDAPTVNPSRPGNTPLPPLSKGRELTSDFRNTFRELARRKGINPDAL